MTHETLHQPSGWIEGSTPAFQWTALIGLSVGFGGFLSLLGVPAALLIGPLLAGIVISGSGGKLRLTPHAFVPVQGLIGCMIARMLPSSIAGEFGIHWPVFAAGVLSVIVASGVLGWLLVRMRVLPGTTALWGVSPGAATVMTLMAEAYGADAQLVAVMQYLRVLMVAAVASVVAKVSGAGLHHVAAAITWFPALAWLPLIKTLALAVLGSLLGRRLRIPMGSMLVTLVAGVVLVRHGWLTIELPRWLLAIAYAFVGWRIGLRFTRPLLAHAARALPRILACSLALIAACGGIGVALVAVAGVDPLTAYLATSPGGADSVAIIAASSNVDVHFVMAMQMARFVAVQAIGPVAARFLARRATANANAARPNDS
ncbi:putative ammonia monooxygenase [Caballeronia udeis]|uniref:Putative ammonia monooxygenase n=1 Tax=Caballeronia udeis TaxID=1232866 RepID=A0A158ITN2_9BURK|nr:AbrB family transcriptional regulator [Caballeronia udeis]SAL60042.1 putative ammonia monooxygenase [Caballeronia udeis]